MASKRLQFRHLFGGGWATDFGPSADVGPNQAGDVIYPWLNEAQNVYFELDGGPHKIGGTSKLNSSVIESGEEIRGLFDFWIQGTSRAPTQKRVVYAGRRSSPTRPTARSRRSRRGSRTTRCRASRSSTTT
jgi:hypothetical protein